MNLSPKNQQGLTLISLIFVLSFLGAMVLLTLKIIPIYLEHSKVAASLAEIKGIPDIQNQTQAEILNSLRKRFTINGITDVTQDDMTITKHGAYLKIVIDYEVVKKIIGNLSILVQFNDVIEVGSP